MKEHSKKNQNYQLPITLVILFIIAIYGQDVTNWLKINYPYIYSVLVILAKALIAILPIIFFGKVYFENKLIIKCLKNNKQLPEKIQKYYGKYIESYSTKTLFIIAWASLIAMVFWAIFMLFLVYRQGANF